MDQLQQSHQRQQQEEAYSNFINSINSDITRKEYNLKFSHFIQYCEKQNHNDMLLIPVGQLESTIRDYIVHLRRDRKLAPATVSSYVAPIVHFYEMNNFTLHWKRLKKFKAAHYSVVEDKPYSLEQIKLLVDAAPLRDKYIILIMCSAGLRRGALQHREEIAQGLVSTRIIELHCPDKWKKRTKPKKVEKNEKFSFSRQEQQDIPQLLVGPDGYTVTEPAATSDKDIVNHEEFSKEPKYADEFPARNELDDIPKESANVDQRLLSEQDRVKELETKIKGIEIALQSESNENIQLKSQVEGLKSKLGRHMNSCYKKNIGIAEVAFTAKVNLAERELTEIQIVDAESLESTN
jgi:hypothetical protein